MTSGGSEAAIFSCRSGFRQAGGPFAPSGIERNCMDSRHSSYANHLCVTPIVAIGIVVQGAELLFPPN